MMTGMRRILDEWTALLRGLYVAVLISSIPRGCQDVKPVLTGED